MASSNYLPVNNYSSLMYGTSSTASNDGSNLSTATTPGVWQDRFSPVDTTSSNYILNTISQSPDTGSYLGGYSDYAQNELLSGRDPYTGMANPYSQGWTTNALGGWGLQALQGVAVPTGTLTAAGIPIGQALTAGIQAGFNPSSMVGTLGNLAAAGIGIQPSAKATALMGGVGTLIGGPIGGIIGAVAAPFASDLLGDLRGTRQYENVRDIIEGASTYGVGRTTSNAFAQNMNTLGNLNVGHLVSNEDMAAAAIADAVNLGQVSSRYGSLSNPYSTAYSSLQALGLTDAQLAGYQNMNDLTQAANRVAALTAAAGTPYRSSSVQSALGSMGLGNLSDIDAAALAMSSSPMAMTSQAGIDAALSAAGLGTFNDMVNAEATAAAERASDMSSGGTNAATRDASGGMGSSAGGGRGFSSASERDAAIGRGEISDRESSGGRSNGTSSSGSSGGGKSSGNKSK